MVTSFINPIGQQVHESAVPFLGNDDSGSCAAARTTRIRQIHTISTIIVRRIGRGNPSVVAHRGCPPWLPNANGGEPDRPNCPVGKGRHGGTAPTGLAKIPVLVERRYWQTSVFCTWTPLYRL
ncbi:MAG: hypothetical protein HC769_06870 [Cyanobacteria bacterium CRU_2_1]|nr:hypothetical protein [Cyanobacteria bacterium RU_5_0]NJR58597.1 hypothetical protein [Cyanobacteria bacterium CRU_2_1]